MDPELKSLQETLIEVTALINLSGDEPPDLISLKNNLMELIALKESELLEERKKIALVAVESAMDENSTMSDKVEPTVIVGQEQIHFSDAQSNFPPGSRCSLPGWTSRGYFINQNAIVAEVINDSASDSMFSRVLLFLVNPTRLNQVPCDQFLTTGLCSNGVLCRFSHGIEVSVNDLSEWYEPDPKAYLQEGHLCLALNRDDKTCPVWHHARIQHTDVDSETCIVEWFSSASSKNSRLNRSESYSELDLTATNLPLVCVHPILDEAQHFETNTSWTLSPCSSSGGNLTDDVPNSTIPNEYQMDASGIRETSDDLSDDSQSQFFESTSADEPLGAWEAHTRGIGTRLLSRMGYTGTGGLGPNGMGRRLPVSMDSKLHQVILNDIGFSRPSVDRLIASHSDPSSIRKRRLKVGRDSSSTVGKSQSEIRFKKTGDNHQGSVFDFLNGTVFGQSKSKSSHISSGVTPGSKSASCKSSREINIQIYDFQRQISSVRAEISKTEDSLRRNETCDRRVAAIASRRLSSLKSSLLSLKKSEKDLSIKSDKQKRVDKLCVF